MIEIRVGISVRHVFVKAIADLMVMVAAHHRRRCRLGEELRR